jgi:hypothetical protein
VALKILAALPLLFGSRIHQCNQGQCDNSLAKRASYQRSKLGTVDNYDPKWKHLLNRIGVCCSPPPTLDQVFENHMVSYNALCGTQNAITPKKADTKVLHGWWKYWRQQGKQVMLGESSKIKDQDWQKLFVLYSAVIFSVISLEMQNGLPPRMYELSTIQGVLTCQLPSCNCKLQTAKYPCKYEVNGAVSGIIHMTTAKESSNEEVDNIDNSGDPYQCDIMTLSSDEDETESITNLKRNPYSSLNYWEGIAFHKSEKALTNALIWAHNYYRGHKRMHICDVAPIVTQVSDRNE